MDSPLDGVKVLDLTRVFAGPVAGRILADLGADVVKIEPPDGDVTRTYAGRGERRASSPQTPYFCQYNAGKRSVTADFSDPDDLALVKALAAEADIVLENFRPGVLARVGLDHASLSAEHPELIMLSISGFGADGPESQRAAYAGVIHAETGVLSRRGAGGEDLEISMADGVSGLHGVIGVLAALRRRDATGEGAHLDLAMVDAMLYVDDMALRQAGPASEILDVVGGPLIVMGDFKWVWHSVSTRLGLTAEVPEGADLRTKISIRRQAWLDFVHGFDDRAELLAALDRANLAWGDVRDEASARTTPTVAHRRSLVEVDRGDGATATVVQSPFRFSNGGAQVAGPVPAPGADRDAVVADWLGRG